MRGVRDSGDAVSAEHAPHADRRGRDVDGLDRGRALSGGGGLVVVAVECEQVEGVRMN